jgi:hypothetical protein
MTTETATYRNSSICCAPTLSDVAANSIESICQKLWKGPARPLFHEYRGYEPCKAWLCLSIKREEVSLDVDAPAQNTVSVDIWHGVIRRVALPPTIGNRKLRRWLLRDNLTQLITRVFCGGEIGVDRNGNIIGKLTDDAHAALSAIDWLANDLC